MFWLYLFSNNLNFLIIIFCISSNNESIHQEQCTSGLFESTIGDFEPYIFNKIHKKEKKKGWFYVGQYGHTTTRSWLKPCTKHKLEPKSCPYVFIGYSFPRPPPGASTLRPNMPLFLVMCNSMKKFIFFINLIKHMHKSPHLPLHFCVFPCCLHTYSFHNS